MTALAPPEGFYLVVMKMHIRPEKKENQGSYA